MVDAEDILEKINQIKDSESSRNGKDLFYNWSKGKTIEEIAVKLDLISRTLRRYIDGDSKPELRPLITEHIKKDPQNPSKWMHSPQMITALPKILH
jgi:hypothetical protein